MRKKIWLLLLLGLVLVSGIWITFNFHFIQYGIEQLSGQISIIRHTEKIEVVLSDQNTPDSIKTKIKQIQRIKHFAENTLGLKKTNNYSTYYDQQNEPSLWVLSACKPFSFEEYVWHFPIFGQSSYKGFFMKSKGSIEQLALIREGFDTDLGPASAWSTLGYFNDPILSSMMKKNEGKLAELIIHELTHATIFVKDNIELNENIATFIGEQGALLYLKEFYSDNPEVILNYKNLLHDDQLYENHFHRTYIKLDSLFSNHSHHEKLNQLKYALILESFNQMDTLPVLGSKKYKYFQTHLPNNTFFLEFKRYRNKQTKFSEELKTIDGNQLNLFIRRYMD